MKVIKPPQPFLKDRFRWEPDQFVIFLGGSIEMGLATDWQSRVETALEDRVGVILNPRRVEWDATWEQSINNPNFVAQVNWELDGLEAADVGVMYFDPATKAPITLLELGLFARHGKLIVCCPEGYWRKGNVDLVCRRFHVRQVPTLDNLIEVLTK